MDSASAEVEAAEVEAPDDEALADEEAAWVDEASSEDEAAVDEASAEDEAAEEDAALDEAAVDDDAALEDELEWPSQESLKADLAESASPSGQMLSKHFLTLSFSFEQIHDKSFNPLQSDFFSTWATQANKQAGGVANVVEMTDAKATKVLIFKTDGDMIVL